MSFESLWFDWSIDLWPLVMGGLVAVTCGLLGTVFLVRRTALLGDAVSHSVLPGVAGGLLAAGLLTRGDTEGHAFGASVAMLFVVAGALIAGTLSTALIEALHRYSRIKPDTALGAVFPAFFAAGVILIEVAARGAHFDLDCVFYGALESIDSFERVVPTLVATGLVVAFFACGYKEILITSFDDALARSLGLRVRVIQRVLIALLAVAVVAAFEAVGAILVVAFLVIPGIVISLAWLLAPLLVLDKGVNPIESLKQSNDLMDGHKGAVFFAQLAVNLVCVVAMVIIMAIAGAIDVGVLSLLAMLVSLAIYVIMMTANLGVTAYVYGVLVEGGQEAA